MYHFEVWAFALPEPLTVTWDFGDGTAKANQYPRTQLGHVYCFGDRTCRMCGEPIPTKGCICPENDR